MLLLKKTAPGVHWRIAHVGVAEVAIEQVEQGRPVEIGQRIDHVGGVGGVRPRLQTGSDGGRDGLVAEAGEPERHPRDRCGPETAFDRPRSIGKDLIPIFSVRIEMVEGGVIGPHRLARHGVGVGLDVGLHLMAVAARRRAEAGSGVSHRHRRRPRRHHRAGRVGAELQVQLIGRWRTRAVGGADQFDPALGPFQHGNGGRSDRRHATELQEFSPRN